MRSPRAVLLEQFRALTDSRTRYVDMSAQLRVYRRRPDSDSYYAAELLPTVYGGRFDAWSKTYAGHGAVSELKCHAAQLDILTYDGPADRILGLGPPGGGKTEGNVVWMALQMLRYPGVQGGVVTPTEAKKAIVWDKFIKLAKPLGWIHDIRPGADEIELLNGAVAKFVSAKRASKSLGSPISGYDWWWALEDEQQNIDDDSCREVDARGRVNPKFRIYSAATNDAIQEFQMRLRGYEENPRVHVKRYSLYDNAFVSLAHIERLKAHYSKEAWRSRILCEEFTAEGRVYPTFAFGTREKPGNVRARPQVATDITARVTQRWDGYMYILATDFGQLTNATAVLKAYRDPGTRDGILWWVVDEIVTHGTTAERHALEIKRKGYNPAECIVIADPYNSDKQDDRSDYVQMRKAGFKSIPANSETIRPKKKRYNMINALLEDATGKRRLFIDVRPDGSAAAPMAVDSMLHLRFLDSGEPDEKNKSIRDLTHYTDALGYGLYPFEKIRGEQSVVFTPGAVAK